MGDVAYDEHSADTVTRKSWGIGQVGWRLTCFVDLDCNKLESDGLSQKGLVRIFIVRCKSSKMSYRSSSSVSSASAS